MRNCSSEERVEVSDEGSESDTSLLEIEEGICTSSSQNEEECATEVLGEVNEGDISSLEADEGILASDNEDKDTTEGSIMKELSKLPPPTCKMIPGSYFPDLCSIKPGR